MTIQVGNCADSDCMSSDIFIHKSSISKLFLMIFISLSQNLKKVNAPCVPVCLFCGYQ